jgi:FkbM family methyltransferase
MIEKITMKLLRVLGYHSPERFRHSSFRQLKKITGIEVNAENNGFLFEALDLLQSLKDIGAVFSEKDAKLMVEARQMKFLINSWEELFILNEVFVKKIYDTNLPDKYALIDIGMNVGITSLFFASKSGCEIIFAYEPFPATIEKANRNFEMNMSFEKIHVFPFGLGYPARKVPVYYSDILKGSVGIYENALANQSSDRQVKELEIRDVAENVERNLTMYEGSYLAKIDCEGAEYEIIRRLDETNLLRRISSFMVEWHGDGAQELKEIFVNNNYWVETHPSEHPYRGMIYSKKKN